MKNPLVTVIIPAYNAEKYIGKCLDSVSKQTMRDFEVLVIDDGSTDRTGDVVKDLTEKDGRIRYLKQKNMGVARTRNKGVSLAKGKFVAFIDNDDYLDEDYLEKLLPKKNEDIVLGGYKRPNSKGKIIRKNELKDTIWSRLVIPAPWAKIYRKNFIVSNKLEFLDNNIGEDVYFNILAMLMAKKVKIVDYVGYNWFFNEKSVSNTRQKKFEDVDVFYLLNSCYDELKDRELLEHNYEILELFFYRYIVWFLLFSCKGGKKKEIYGIHDKLLSWLIERFPNFTKNKYLKRGQLKEEERITRMSYEVFLRFYKIGLSKELIWAYAKL